jgi:hypothetical protein
VSFADAVLTDAVGASVGGQAGAAGTSVTIRPASVGVAPTRTSAGRVPGQVDAPELRGVALSTTTSATGTVSTTATYTFDQAIGNAAVPAASLPFFNLYLADGTRLEATACAVPTNATATNTQVVCSAFVSSNAAQNTNNGGATSATIASATLGTVEAGAVTGTAASGNTNPNPIGAENTTGGTGTPATGGGTTVTAPTVTGLSVATGGTAGGTVVTITGTNLTGATGVTFGGVAGTSFSVGAGGTSITVTTPAGTAGARDVVVLSPSGNVTRTGGFTFA